MSATLTASVRACRPWGWVGPWVRRGALALALIAGGASAGGAQPLTLQQVLELGLPVSVQLERAERQLQRDSALVGLNRSLLMPQLNVVGLGSYTQVGTSVGVLTNLPTLGDLSLSLENEGYAVLRNSFGNASAPVTAAQAKAAAEKFKDVKEPITRAELNALVKP